MRELNKLGNVAIDKGLISATQHVHGFLCRQPSISRRHGTNGEQFSRRSDVIKFPSKPNKNHIYSWRRFHSFRILSAI